MAHRWSILALLFTVRLSMAFQFQSVASMSPAIMKQFGVGLADIGLLIGLYLTPGVIFAIPGGAIGRRFGDKQVILFGLALMMCGGAVMTIASAWEWQIAGRVLAGIGGVLLNVLMSKIVADWFEGKEIATALAIFVNSWPAGIALSLFIIPAIVAAQAVADQGATGQGVTGQGVSAAFFASTGFCGIGFVLLALLYREPPRSPAGAGRISASWPHPEAIMAMVAAGCIWGLFNAALGMVFGFGTTMLVERDWTLATAGSVTSLVLWIVTLSVPVGGILADRTGKPVIVMLVGFALFAVTLFAAPRTDAIIPAFVALGIFGGLSAGPIMSLPSRVLTSQVRAVGMGIYLTLFYIIVFAAPIFAGFLAGRSGTSKTAFDFGCLMLALCFPAYWLFNRLAAKANAQRPATA